MSSSITQVASDLNDQVPNRYELVLEIAELGKRLLDEAREQRLNDPFSLDANTTPDKVIYQALIMKASEMDMEDGLIG